MVGLYFVMTAPGTLAVTGSSTGPGLAVTGPFRGAKCCIGIVLLGFGSFKSKCEARFFD